MPTAEDNVEDNAGDDDFASGFSDTPATPTTTPVTTEAAAAEPVVEATPAVVDPEHKLTQTQYDDLLRRASSIDDVRAEHKKLLDSAFGKLGSQQQLLERLQSSTQAGKAVKVTEADFQELIDEGYTELAQMQAAGLNRVLEKIQLRGTEPEAAKAEEPDFKKIFSDQFTPERAALKEEVRYELAHDALTDMHEDWESVLKTPAFEEWSKANKIAERKDRKGVLFNDSIDPRFVGKILTDFKAASKKSSTRQNVLAAAVTPRGSGGIASPTDDDDDFHSGFSG